MKIYRVNSPSYTTNSDRPARWKITSNWSNIALVRKYFILKWIFEELTAEEYKFVVDTMNPKFDHFMVAVKLFHKLKNKKDIQTIFNTYYSTNEKTSWNKEVYKNLRAEARKSLKLEIFFTKRRKGIKYSGWRRHQNDKGSLGPNVIKDFEYIIPETEENMESKFIDTLLSVLENLRSQETRADESKWTKRKLSFSFVKSYKEFKDEKQL